VRHAKLRSTTRIKWRERLDLSPASPAECMNGIQRQDVTGSTLLSVAIAVVDEPVHPLKPFNQIHCDRYLSDAQIFKVASA
jgi:hypothetical protein